MGEQGDDHDVPVFSVRDLEFQIEVTSAILRTIDLDQMLYVVLSGVTSGEGLGFNRGVFLLVDEGQRQLRVNMAIGPVDKEEAHRIWEDMVSKDLTLVTLLSSFEHVRNDPLAHLLTHRLGQLSLSLDMVAARAELAPNLDDRVQAPIDVMLAKALADGSLITSSTVELVHGDVRFANWCMVPLRTPDRSIGILVVDNAFSGRSLGPRGKHMLVALANLTAIAVEKGRLFNRMRSFAEVDGLTGLANRRVYDEAIERMLTEARQTGRSVSLVVLDVDHFKRCNDLHGHLVGDDVLKGIAQTIGAHARRNDVVARYGGEEFAVLLADTTLEQAQTVARKLVRAVREAEICEGRVGHVTISAGVATSPGGVLDAVGLFDAADRAVYRAKRNGRDRVEIAGAETRGTRGS